MGYYNNTEIKKGHQKDITKNTKRQNKQEKSGKQIKYVPIECKTKETAKEIRYYQYTCIDEASRERYLYWYEEHTPMNTVDL